MESIREFFHLFSIEGIEQIIKWGGLLILTAIVFAETGLLIGFFLPGDSLLVTAGFFAAKYPSELNIWHTLILLSIAAIAGDSAGYAIGRRAGMGLYNRPQSRFFHREHLLKTKAFYEKYGGITIILARFMPFARTFAPVVAGIAQMDYRRFVTFNVLGGIGWVVSMSLLGYFFGQIPFVKNHIEKAILVVILLSVAPVVLHVWKSRRERLATSSKPAVGSD